MQLVCPYCSQRNRIPTDRLAQGPVCGNCHRALLEAPIELGSADLPDLLAQQQLPVLIDFWAPWCAPCRGFAPTFKAAAAKSAGATVFAKVNTEAEPELGQRFKIRAIPTLVAFFNGEEIARVSGALPPAELDRMISQAVVRAGA